MKRRTFVVTVEDRYPALPTVMKSIWLRPYAVSFDGGVERIVVRRSRLRLRLRVLGRRLQGARFVKNSRMFPMVVEDEHVPGGPEYV